ncbi:type II secretion system F family protein [Pseudomonas turukhanskensis]|uniref:General secretion pathway protein GspF n=1 Tax=Pseudomonas turukhanskensis TaxID=1806536 RepID=A0A9W6K700_9PSED|nr:type II secretion system F family protein [Pseudomonas turukhanskensis]GLK89391.1 general secretion pathway protein GspF [Pseudomonas turukhanskensis]
MASTRHKPLPYAERALLFSQLAALENAGMPVASAFKTLQISPPTQKRIEVAARLLNQGTDVASAGLASALFSPLEVALVRAAQSAGSPARVYQRLADSYSVRAQQIKTLRSRLLMPLGVLLLGLLVQPLPELVAGTLSVAEYCWGVAYPLLGLMMAGWLGKTLLRRLEKPAPLNATAADAWMLQVPLLGSAYSRRNTRDYFESLGLMLEAGMPMFEALPKAAASVSNHALRREFSAMQQRVLAGEALSQAMAPMGFLGRPQLMNLVHTGEASGTLAQTLLAYATRESQTLANQQDTLLTWLPRLLYIGVATWMAYSLIIGAGVPPMPEGL